MNDLVLFTLTMVGIIVLIFGLVKLSKSQKLLSSNQIQEISSLVIDLASKAIEIASISPEEYSNEDEFRDALADIVTSELINQLEDSDNPSYEIFMRLSDDEIKNLICVIFKIFKKEIGLEDLPSEIFNSLEKPKVEDILEHPDIGKEVSEELVDANIIENKDTLSTDITTDINDFYKL